MLWQSNENGEFLRSSDTRHTCSKSTCRYICSCSSSSGCSVCCAYRRGRWCLKIPRWLYLLFAGACANTLISSCLVICCTDTCSSTIHAQRQRKHERETHITFAEQAFAKLVEQFSETKAKSLSSCMHVCCGPTEILPGYYLSLERQRKRLH